MKYYVTNGGAPPAGAELPCILLRKDNWDDYGYKTTFHASYFDELGAKLYIGIVKILHKSQDSTEIESPFSNLPSDYCSLGQGFDYYRGVAAWTLPILKDLRDIATNRDVMLEFQGHPGIRNSLFRSSEAERTFREASDYLKDKGYPVSEFKFKFSTLVAGATKPHVLDLNFEFSRIIPNRIFGIIGPNGTGKSRVLANLANAISGNKLNCGDFDPPERPPFGPVIVLSYGVFDAFELPDEQSSASYIYCGLWDESGQISTDVITRKLRSAFGKIVERGLGMTWRSFMRRVLGDESFQEILSDLDDVLEGKKTFGALALSSGQSMLLCVGSDIIANSNAGALYIFDEPETHLHPTAISRLLSALYAFLASNDSYLIVSTHSPQILQDIPSKFVRIFERVGTIPIIRKSDVETFGQNIETIAKQVYDTVDIRSLFQKHVQSMVIHSNSVDEINDAFEGKLGIGALAYMNSQFVREQR